PALFRSLQYPLSFFFDDPATTEIYTLSLHDALPISEQRRSSIVEVHDGPARALERLEGALDELVARLGEDLDGDVLRDQVLLDQQPAEIEVGLRGGRETDLDFLEADLAQGSEHPQLALGVHGLDQRLVAVTQVDAAPDRRVVDGVGRPLA